MQTDRWYFAYGSNLSVDQKQSRTGTIRRAIRCRLPGYRLAFNKRGEAGQIYANIVAAEESERAAEVWGVAYLCNPEALRKMDRCEGVASGHYEHIAVRVLPESGPALDCLTYVAGADFVCKPGKPSGGYLETIVAGALHHRLPADYIEQIQRLAQGD